jgi:hypothetical protein
MKLCDIFEKFERSVDPTTSQPAPLEPGEFRTYLDIELRNIDLIRDKLLHLEDLLYKSRSLKDAFMKDAQLQQTMANLIAKLNRKQDYMHKLKQRPTTDQNKVINVIKQECSDFIEIAKQANKFLYRGIHSHASAGEGLNYLDRKSLHSNPEISEYFDQALQAHGVKALRKNSTFATTDRSFARNFGYTVYLIFPKNGFNFLSTSQRDLILDSWNKIADMDKKREFLKELVDWIEANVPEYSVNDMYISARYSYNSESVFYHLQQNFADENPMKLPEQFNKSIKDFVSYDSVIKQMKPNTTDLLEPMNTGVEILLNGEYWAVRADQWEAMFSKLLHVDDEF